MILHTLSMLASFFVCLIQLFKGKQMVFIAVHSRQTVHLLTTFFSLFVSNSPLRRR